MGESRAWHQEPAESMAAGRRMSSLPRAGRRRRLGLGGVWDREQEGRNSLSFHPATCNAAACKAARLQGCQAARREAARALQEQTQGGKCAPESSGEQQTVPGQKTRLSLALQQPAHAAEGLSKAALHPLLHPSSSWAGWQRQGTTWQNQGSQAGHPPHWEQWHGPRSSTWHCHRAGQGSGARALPAAKLSQHLTAPGSASSQLGPEARPALGEQDEILEL